MLHSDSPLSLNQVFSQRCACLSAIVALVALSGTTQSLGADKPTRVPPPVVRLVYVIPADRVLSETYVERMEAAIRHARIWYRNEMDDGTAFDLPEPVIGVVQTSQVADWYSTNFAGEDPALWFFFNFINDVFPRTGARFFDPNNIWVFYIDSDPACGQLLGGTSGVAVVGANDLRGLAGEPTVSPCANEPPDTAGVCRWVGGLGHELGHALGLPHPSGCEDSDPNTACPTNALMWLGYITYPETFLLDQDRALLMQSPFFSPSHLRRSLPDCSDLGRKR